MIAVLAALCLLLSSCTNKSPGLLSADIYETRQFEIVTNEVVFTSFVYTYAETNELARAIRRINAPED